MASNLLAMARTTRSIGPKGLCPPSWVFPWRMHCTPTPAHSFGPGHWHDFPLGPLPSPSGRFSSSATGYSEPDAKRARGQARALRSGSVFRTVRSFVRLRSFVQGRRIAHMLRWGRKAAAKVHSAHFPTLSHFVPCFLLPAAQLRWIS